MLESSSITIFWLVLLKWKIWWLCGSVLQLINFMTLPWALFFLPQTSKLQASRSVQKIGHSSIASFVELTFCCSSIETQFCKQWHSYCWNRTSRVSLCYSGIPLFTLLENFDHMQYKAFLTIKTVSLLRFNQSPIPWHYTLCDIMVNLTGELSQWPITNRSVCPDHQDGLSHKVPVARHRHIGANSPTGATELGKFPHGLPQIHIIIVDFINKRH